MGRSITKEEIATLEVEEFPGNIIVVDTIEKAEEAVKYLSGFSILGFDTETRPAYKKGNLFGVALVQLALPDTCYLFRLNIIGFPSCLLGLLSDPDILKIGLSLRDDFLSMSRKVKFIPKGFIDLQMIVPKHEITDLSLQKVYALLFSKKISKSQRLSNWETDVLTGPQQKYAALDAWACLKIYEVLENELCNTKK